MNLRWGDISLGVGERVAAQEHAEIARAALRGYPDPALLADRLVELDARIRRASDLGLTPAELRILPFLPTHLSLAEIATRMYLSRATVKTHVASVYAKLEASTRSDAVEKMEELGLNHADARRTPESGVRSALKDAA